MRLRTTIVILCFILALIGSIFGTYFNYSTTNEILTEQVYHHLETTAQSRADHVDEFLKYVPKILPINASIKQSKTIVVLNLIFSSFVFSCNF